VADEATVLGTRQGAAPLSLYLDVEKGALADMAAVAKASLAFTELVREVAYLIDPSLEVRIQLKNGTEGSLSLNAFLRDLKDPVTRRKTLLAVAIAVGSFLALQTASWTWEEGLDALFAEDELSEQDRREIEEIARRVSKENVARPERQRLFEALSEDPNITGVGATMQHGKRPDTLIPREEFQTRAGLDGAGEEPDERFREDRLWITLVSPFLADAHRRWKFRIGDEELGVYMEDHVFLERVLQGRTFLPMREGMELDVTIQLHEQHLGGDTWKIAGHQTILQVHGMRAPGMPTLPLLPEQ
jgi:hypothetical protein